MRLRSFSRPFGRPNLVLVALFLFVACSGSSTGIVDGSHLEREVENDLGQRDLDRSVSKDEDSLGRGIQPGTKGSSGTDSQSRPRTLDEVQADMERAGEECWERYKDTRPREERQRLFEQCVQAAGDPPTPYASDPMYELVRWQDALAWWPYRPLLRATDLPRSGAREALFASSKAGGRTGDPRAEWGALSLVYEIAPHTTDRSTYQEVIDGGGVWVEVGFVPRGEQPPDMELAHRKVMVRENVVRLTEFRREGETDLAMGRYRSNVDKRMIIWEVPAGNGGVLQWRITNHPGRYTDRRTIDWADGLQEVA